MKEIRRPLALALAALLSGCAMFAPKKSTPLKVSAALPSTDGFVYTRKARNGNYSLSLSIRCMPKPQRLTPPAETYVVWTRNAANAKAPWENMGALQASKKKTATFATVTPLDQFEVWITTEPSTEAAAPTGPRLLWADVSSR